ncbi:PhzF family phenazine biosynthesis protein [Bacillus sp. Au-Bac7]|uniref:PhzF family phenazine biosynthesis protein n=1 Tax=Bacillus sp. Au-Bac7 TaxID=2906458 RepID=UPI001E4AF4BC|nr:PhzF family phenazine biosynthesis protein [Bacillus sp. Au-Bac7]MCE4049570.1 PhzF family phenazine biosynthesis protein [Bacillus sp. Au-Bac7]
MNIQVFIVNAFTKNKSGGNPAGVVVDGDGLSAENMQYIASEMGLSETAFIQSSSAADYKIKYFTPVSEVDLCGHATIASFALLVQRKAVSKNNFTIETKAGILPVRIEGEKVFLTQNNPQFGQELDKKEIAESLQINEADIMTTLPIEIVSTGLKDIIIPVKNNQVLQTLQPDFNRMKEISAKLEVVGYHVFTLDTDSGVDAFCRNFAPLYDINEESATGTASGALTGYLYKHNVVKPGATSLIFEQGHAMNAPSEIISHVKVDANNNVEALEVGGEGMYISSKWIELL